MHGVGMTLHIGADSRDGLAYGAVVSAASVHDKHALPDLLHCHERRVQTDAAHASRNALTSGKASGAAVSPRSVRTTATARPTKPRARKTTTNPSQAHTPRRYVDDGARQVVAWHDPLAPKRMLDTRAGLASAAFIRSYGTSVAALGAQCWCCLDAPLAPHPGDQAAMRDPRLRFLSWRTSQSGRALIAIHFGKSCNHLR